MLGKTRKLYIGKNSIWRVVCIFIGVVFGVLRIC